MHRYFIKCVFLLLAQLAACQCLAQAFWEEDFSAGIPRTWGNEDLSGNQFLWKHCHHSSGCLPPSARFLAKSSENGFAVLQSATQTHQVNPHQSALTSERIDCSEYNHVQLEFEAFLAGFHYNAAQNAVVRVRSSQGIWVEYKPFPLLSRDSVFQISHNPEKISLDISLAAAGKSEVEIQWLWVGQNEEFWAIDDIRLFDAPPFYQNEVWGREAEEGTFDGGMQGWISHTLEAPHVTEHVWQWDSIGYIGNALAAKSSAFEAFRFYPYLYSYSNANGAMVFNADYYVTGGVSGVSPPFPYFHAELISPPINLADVPDEVALQFSQFVLKLNEISPDFPTVTNISYSLNGGRNWEPAIGVNEAVKANEPVNNTVQVSLPGAAGKSNVRVKFIFAGDLYFWAIDDILIVRRKTNDLRIRDGFFGIAPNIRTPKSQVETIGFLCEVENFGTATQRGINAVVDVRKKADGTLLFTDTLLIDSLLPGSTYQDSFFRRTFLPESEPEKFEVQYQVFGRQTDDYPEDNYLAWQFEVTDSIYAKETGPTTRIRPAGFSNYFQYGNCFYIPRGKGYKATHLTFGIANTNQLAGARVNLFLYRFFSDENANTYVDQDEFALVGFGEYTILGNESQTNGGIIQSALFDLSGEPGVRLEDNVYYIAAVQYIDAGGIPCILFASQEYDYYPMNFRHEQIGIPRYAGVEEINGRFDLLSLGLDLTPLIRLHISPVTYSSLKEKNPEPDTDFILYPNPAKKQIYLQINHPGRHPTTIEIWTPQGQMAAKYAIKSSVDQQSPLRLPPLPSGPYICRIWSDGIAPKSQILMVE